MVRSTNTAPIKRKDGTLGKRNPVRNFKDQPILEHAPRFEIEVELINRDARKDPTVESLFKELMYSVVDVLRAIQGSNQLITESEKVAIREAYGVLTAEYQPKPREEKKKKQDTTETEPPKPVLPPPIGFIGFNPVTLKLENIEIERTPGQINIRSVMERGKTVGYYNVTDKADGLRCFGYTSPTGDFYLIDMSLNIYKTGLVNPSAKNSLVDGEFITKAQHIRTDCLDTLYIFDYYIGEDGDKKVRDLPFYDGTPNCRHAKLEEWVAALDAANAGKQQKFAVQLKTFEFASKLEGEESIFSKAERIWSQREGKPYHTDGLIFTPNLSPLPGAGKLRWSEQFKWKPADQNTIDFLVVFDKDEFGRTIFTEIKDQQVVQYKRMFLLVMSDNDQNLRETYLNSDSLRFLKESNYRPVLFNPMDPPDLEASNCRVELFSDSTTEEGKDYKEYIVCEGSKEVLYDNTVVEMACDLSRPKGWQWYPMRVRQDKTERYRRAIAERKPMSRVMNDANTANDVWNSIHNAVTAEMITTGIVETKKKGGIEEAYYERTKIKSKDADKTRPMRDFHKKNIKGDLLFNAIHLLFKANKKSSTEATPYNPLLLDLACGIGGDVVRYLKTEPHAVLGIDVSKKNILNPDFSAYTFFIDELKRMKPKEAEAAPTMFFILGDSSKRIKDGSCSILEGAVETDKLILQALFGEPQDQPINYERVVKNLGAFKGGLDAIVLMFALHYFFENEEKFQGLLRNIDELLKVGGFFVGCNFDGEAIFKFLQGVEKRKGEVEIKKDKKETVWEIRKKYADSDIQSDKPFGNQIDVMFKSISDRATPEYLVNWTFFVKAMKSIGCELLTEEEAKKVGLPASDQMFKATYDALPEDKRPKMEVALSDYSFLNRWWVFQRKSKGPAAAVVVSAEALAEGKEGEVDEGVREVAITPAPVPAPVGLPKPAETVLATYPISDDMKLSSSIKQLLLSNKLYEAQKDIPKDLPLWFSPMTAFTYKYKPADDAPEQKYACFYHYFYARMILESGIGDTKGIGAKFRTEGEYGRPLKAFLGLQKTLEQTTTELLNASKSAKKVVDDLRKTNQLNTAWNPKAAVKDALRQRFATASPAKTLLCKLKDIVEFEYITVIEPLIGITTKTSGKNVYGQVLKELADEFCGGAGAV